MWDKLFGGVNLLGQGMQAAWTRNAVIRNNIANAETPGFKSSDVEFESFFLQSLLGIKDTDGFKAKLTRSKHIDFSDEAVKVDTRPRIIKNEDRSMLFNQNNVDVEAESVKLAQNSLFYNTLLAKMNGELARIKLAVRDGK
ncbi:MAG: flagellar basal body rod protein FlgB [Clostridiales bacterium]|nr:flagellar basal body rod protein FlgB [Clostridiales bacterium]